MTKSKWVAKRILILEVISKEPEIWNPDVRDIIQVY